MIIARRIVGVRSRVTLATSLWRQGQQKCILPVSQVHPSLVSRPLSSQSDGSDQQKIAWNVFYSTVAGVGVATAVGIYWKIRSSKSKRKDGSSADNKTTKKRSWDEEKKLLAKLPERIPFLIVGAGTAAFSAARSIRANEPTAKVVLVGEEPFLPYMRPPLSKELWLTPSVDTEDIYGPVEQPAFLQWNGRPRSVFLEKSQFYCDLEELGSRENGGIAVGNGIRVVSLNPKKQSVVVMPACGTEFADAPRREISYDKCLIATGGKPRVPPAFENLSRQENVALFRNLTDYKKLVATADRLAEKGGSPSVAIVGGGFLGCELAFVLAWRAQQMRKKLKVYQIIRERGVLDHVLPAYLSAWTADRLKEAGVEIVTATEVSKAENAKSGGVTMKLTSGEELSASHVVLAAGIDPNTDLAEEAGLEVDDNVGGIAVNSELMARNNIWAAGDVSSFYDPRLRARRRVEHHDQAIVSGRLAGENMTGAAKVYSQQSMFWSDLGPSVSFEAVGLVDSSLQTYAVFSQPENKTDSEKPEDFKRGVVFYLSGPKPSEEARRLVGILLWNLPGRVGVARRLLKEQPKLDSLDGGTEKLTEMARIMQLTEDDSELDLPPADIEEESQEPAKK